ncbi:cell division protein ZapA [Motiliproteus sp. MSK22-1]|uniref:cell division protein ZapA n=1 Tax=Motiliproteus sp. MSK22-1 TaxID=1897630 RepID=UPI000978A0E7|nr:cell division protein ZapA [Motiliproteus sp. MSK22-1]OMH38987.1 hypothetical protein BGP75_04485 [Motiliproteus sp. MSK22-1]
MKQHRDKNNVSIKVIDKEFLINCPEEAQPELMEAAKYLDQRMHEIKSGGRVYGMERIAVMAALNLSHELLKARQETAELNRRLDQKISQALANTDSKE